MQTPVFCWVKEETLGERNECRSLCGGAWLDASFLLGERSEEQGLAQIRIKEVNDH